MSNFYEELDIFFDELYEKERGYRYMHTHKSVDENGYVEVVEKKI
jgi:hypothetical protein